MYIATTIYSNLPMLIYMQVKERKGDDGTE